VRLNLLLSFFALILFSCDAMLSPDPPASITVTTPSSNGESWDDAVNKTITWTNTGSISDVTIYLYRSSSSSGTYLYYQSIDSYETNDGSYTWNISSSLVSSSYYYKIRIEDYTDASIYDESYYFTIETAASITVTTPSSNGESWDDAVNKTIQWTSTGSISNVKIYLYRSTGSSSGTYSLYQNIDVYETNDGSYSWNIPDSYASSSYYYKIRIVDYTDPLIYDESYYFIIN